MISNFEDYVSFVNDDFLLTTTLQDNQYKSLEKLAYNYLKKYCECLPNYNDFINYFDEEQEETIILALWYQMNYIENNRSIFENKVKNEVVSESIGKYSYTKDNSKVNESDKYNNVAIDLLSELGLCDRSIDLVRYVKKGCSNCD